MVEISDLEVKFGAKPAVDCKVLHTPPFCPQSHVPICLSYCLYSWHSVSRCAMTLALQPQTLKELVPFGNSWHPRLSPMAAPSAKVFPSTKILSFTVNLVFFFRSDALDIGAKRRRAKKIGDVGRTIGGKQLQGSLRR